jgi:hypothetical protein
MPEHHHIVVGLSFDSKDADDRFGSELGKLHDRGQDVGQHRDAPDAAVGAASAAVADLAEKLSSGASNEEIRAALSSLREVTKNQGGHLVHLRAGDKGAGPTAHLQDELNKAQTSLQNAATALGQIAAAGQSAAGHASGVVNAGSGSQVANNVAGLFGDLSSAVGGLGDLIGGPAGAALNALAAVIGTIGDVISSVFGDGSANSSGDNGTDNTPPPDNTDPGDPAGDGDGDGGCFTASTTVLMADGSRRPIGELAVGDVVLGRDEITGATDAGEIEQVFTHHVGRTLTLRLVDGVDVETTSVHRFASPGGGFVDAGSLRPGDELVTRRGTRAVVKETVELARPAMVYNLTVGQLHTYFVGSSDVWVHNLKDREDEHDPADTGSDDGD